MSTIGFIGAGNMAQAIIKGIINSKQYAAQDIIISDVIAEQIQKVTDLYSVTPADSNQSLVRKVDVIVLSVKPQSMSKVIAGIKDSVKPGTLVISIAAGITTSYLSKNLTEAQVIRAMPNTPAMVDEGAAALYTSNATDDQVKHAVRLFSAIGKAVVVDKEELIDAVTAVSGSGPAYFFLLMEEMVRVAEQMGIPPQIAEELVYQTAKGAGVLAMRAYARSESPAELRRKVTSPKGTTEAAINVMQYMGFSDVISKALEAARLRSIELSSCFEDE